jgi:hypothetical protein
MAVVSSTHREFDMRTGKSIRAKVAAAFRRLAGGVDGKTAFAHAKAFYLASGNAWAHCFV